MRRHDIQGATTKRAEQDRNRSTSGDDQIERSGQRLLTPEPAGQLLEFWPMLTSGES
jgi:hypothetical protein